LKPGGRKGKGLLFTEGNYEGMSEEDIIQIDDSDEECEPKQTERLEKKPIVREGSSKMESEDEIETDDFPIGNFFFYFVKLVHCFLFEHFFLFCQGISLPIAQW
jgi:hypothetical protein